LASVLKLLLVFACWLPLAAVQAAPTTPAGPVSPEAAEPAQASASQAASTQAKLQRLLQSQGWIGPPTDDGAPSSTESGWLSGVRDGAGAMVRRAMGFLGVPYVRGGNNSQDGFDCSGFTRYIFEHSLGMVLPRRADEQARSDRLLTINRSELKPGDLVFFNTMRRTFSHVGIYLGDGKFIHAPRAGEVVRVEDMRSAYWSRRFTGARRAPQPES
jgi:cell wall-associated NlpC family hydrolase